jgi:uncharacterized surface anchored protein
VVQETDTPDGFALNSESYPVDLVYRGQTATVNIENVTTTDKPTTLDIFKVDALTGEPLAGVTFAIKDSEGNITELVTGADGYAPYPDLPRGSYTVYETATLPGYIPSDERVEVVVDEFGLIEGQASFELLFTNDFTKVEIGKTDIVTGKPVIGAVLEIYPVDADGNITDEPLYSWTTAEDAYYIERLMQGDYILREHTAPDGYVVAQDVAFTVKDTGEIQAVEMQDDFTKLEITKAEDNGKPLSGATLQIVDKDGKVVYEWISTDSPYLIELNAQGEYTLHEVSAPEGYDLAEDVSFTVEDTADLKSISMTDAKTPEPEIPEPQTPEPAPLDKTGREGNIPFALVGILALMTLGGALFAVRHLRARKSDSEAAANDEATDKVNALSTDVIEADSEDEDGGTRL